MKPKLKLLTTLIGVLASQAFSFSALAEQQKDFAPKISPDGKQIVYYSYRGNELPDLFISDVSGDNERQLTHTPGTWEIVPTWSPDGKMIIFSAGPGMSELEIHSIHVDGTHTRQLTSGDGKGHAPSWMPDGQSFFYTRMYEDGSSDIYRKWLDSGLDINYTSHYSGKNLTPIVSPSGKQVAFVSDRGEGDDLDIFVARLDSSKKKFSNIKQIQEDDTRQDFITWTPDEKQVIYSGPGHDNGKHDLFAVSVTTGDTTRVTNDAENHQYFSGFSPDGKYLYLDIGDWSRNYFFYRSDWTTDEFKPKQISGRNWVDTIAVMEQEFLAPMVGTWKGVSTHGSAKGRFEERVTYRWGPNKKSLIVDMEMLWDGQSYGKATGLLGLDRATKKIYYNLTMEDGTIVMQEQQNGGVADSWEMNVNTFGDSRLYPKSMFVKYSRNGESGDKRTWRSDIYIEQDGEQQLIDVHEFTLLN